MTVFDSIATEFSYRLKVGYPELCPYGSQKDSLHRDRMCPKCHGWNYFEQSQNVNAVTGQDKDGAKVL